MKVLTLNKPDFANHCLKLEQIVSASFTPDAVVGIASGGVRVAEFLFKDKPHLEIEARRPSTRTKENMGFAMKIARKLPECLRNSLRIIEAKLLAHKKVKTRPNIEFDTTKLYNYNNILIVDDAVDSGVTLDSVVSKLSSLPNSPQIKTAVITVTTSNPVIIPDYTLYNNHILIRFPWSKDNRAEK